MEELVRLKIRDTHGLATSLPDLRRQLDKPSVTARLGRSEACPERHANCSKGLPDYSKFCFDVANRNTTNAQSTRAWVAATTRLETERPAGASEADVQSTPLGQPV